MSIFDDDGEDDVELVVTGPRGPRGPKGDTGAAGKDGRDGIDGKDGRDGKDGKAGRDGTNGKDGKQGPKGDKGDRGEAGKNGKDGKAGANGTSLDFKWEGTSLGVKRSDQKDFKFSDLGATIKDGWLGSGSSRTYRLNTSGVGTSLLSSTKANAGTLKGLVAGTNVTLTDNGDSITIDASGGGGGSGAVDSVNGQTGVVVLNAVDIGLGNVNNTSDANKPISTATQAALDTKQDIILISQATIDFGAFSYMATVSIPDATVTSSTRVMVSVAGTGGRDADELEFSPLSVAAIVTDGVGYDIIATAPLGADGQFNINHFKN